MFMVGIEVVFLKRKNGVWNKTRKKKTTIKKKRKNLRKTKTNKRRGFGFDRAP